MANHRIPSESDGTLPVSGESSFRRLVAEAWSRRAALRTRTSAFRLLNGAASGTPGLVVDVFSPYLVVYAYAADLRERYGDFARVLAEITGAGTIALKDRASPEEGGRAGHLDLLGAVPETAAVREGPLEFILHLRHPRNVGLFLDTRPLRERLAELCRSHDVLNLFSYTCSLGVAGAIANSGSVVNVDISQRYLAMGRENFRANGLQEAKAKFVRMDSEDYLDWASRKSLAFDVVILDPPSFSRSEKGVYSFVKDYWRLLEKCAGRLRPQGRLFALTNYGQISPERFRGLLEETLERAGRRLSWLQPIPAPEDFDPGRVGERLPGREGALIVKESVLE